MAIANQLFWDKYEGARVEDPEYPGQPWVDMAVISKLLDKWPAEDPFPTENVDLRDYRLFIRCSDQPGENVARVPGHGWFHIGTKQAKVLAELLGASDVVFRGA